MFERKIFDKIRNILIILENKEKRNEATAKDRYEEFFSNDLLDYCYFARVKGQIQL